MNTLKKIKNIILNNHLTVVITSSKTNTLFIMNLLDQLSIKDQYKTTLFSFNIKSNYYCQKLVSYISKIDYKTLNKYYYPYSILWKDKKDKISNHLFIKAIETIHEKNIIMESKSIEENKDYINEIIENYNYDVLVIDNAKILQHNANFNIKNIINKIKNKQKHLVLLINKYKQDEINIIKTYKKYTKNFILIDGKNQIEYKDITIKIFSSKTNKEYNLKFNKNNRIIKNKKI